MGKKGFVLGRISTFFNFYNFILFITVLFVLLVFIVNAYILANYLIILQLTIPHGTSNFTNDLASFLL